MKYVLLILGLLAVTSCRTNENANSSTTKLIESSEVANVKENMQYQPSIEIISHATFTMNWDGTIIYIDPVGGASAFEGKPAADLVLITDIHSDHADAATLSSVIGDAPLVTPQAVATKIGADFKPIIIENDDTKTVNGFKITAIPMYNITPERMKFHEKGRGNGYVIEKDGYRVYISGDTEDIPEMRALKNIDLAFVCMNLPYTMTAQNAASAVLDFKPKKIIPYHYRGTEGKQDINAFKSIVNKGNPVITVDLMNWYPEEGN